MKLTQPIFKSTQDLGREVQKDPRQKIWREEMKRVEDESE